MATKTLIASAIVLGLMAGPTLAEENAHHYLGGVRGTHLMKHPETSNTVAQQKKRYTFNVHRYQGAPWMSMPHNPQ